MQFLKKHYEKVLLSIVLLGLAAAAAALPYMVSQARAQIDSTVNSVVRSKAKPWIALDLSTNQEVIRRIEGPVKVALAGQHNLFNPVKWVRREDGRVVKLASGNELGAGALVVTRIEPLDMSVTFDGVSTNADKLHYTLTVLKENISNTSTNQRSAQLGVRGQFFTIESVNGPSSAPESLVVRLKEGNELITVTKGRPYKRTVEYMADMAYPPQNQNLFKKREKDSIIISGDGGKQTYKIVAINQSEVVLSAEPSGKRTTVKLSPAPR